MTTNNRILKLFKSRNTLIDQFDNLDYDISDYSEFSINEIDAMNNHDQLDMTISHRKTDSKISDETCREAASSLPNRGALTIGASQRTTSYDGK